jgi:hypothetical protein
MDVYLVNKSGFGFLYSSQNKTDQSDPYIVVVVMMMMMMMMMIMMNVPVT